MMDASSPVYAALGAIGFDALDDLSHWLDVSMESTGAAERMAWPSHPIERSVPASSWEA
jgi:hypothetical protein